MEVSGQLHAPDFLSSVEDARYPLDRRLGGTQSMTGCGGEEKKSPHRPFREEKQIPSLKENEVMDNRNGKVKSLEEY
jgi:hypothetical protein